MTSLTLTQTQKDKDMNAAFEYITALEYRIKALKNEVDKFKSGEKYLTMQEDSRKIIRSLERRVKERDQEIYRSHQETARVRKYWFEVFEDMQKEHAREVAKLQAEKKELEHRALRAERKCGELSDKKKELLHKLYDALTQLEDEKGKNQKLTVQMNRPIELLRGNNTGEREPKAKWLLALLGFICLGAGYYIAITTESPIQAILLFLVAVLLVMAGTYLLFTAGSIVILKLMRHKKSFYYRTRNFISISGMIYRMKQNAIGLASICILSTGVLLMISMTVSLYSGMHDIMVNRYPFEVDMDIRYQP